MPILSVVIPTHNRSAYAVPTIRSILRLSPDIEVVVTDTSDSDHITPAFADDPRWTRVRLVRPGHDLSVVDNFNAGLAAATGEYLIFIGDDDFLSPPVIDLVRWSSAQGIDAIKVTFPALYYWPDFIHKRLGQYYAGTLHLSPFTGRIARHDAHDALKNAAADFGGGVGDMPRAYAGILSSRLARQIVQKYGHLFGGVSPDIYSAALISREASYCIKVDYPVIIPGASGASTAGQSANGRHVGGLRDNPHIGAFHDLVWNDLIPEFYSVPTVWSFSLGKAIERIGDKGLHASYGRLYVRCLFYHRRHITATLAAWHNYRRKVGVLRSTLPLAAAAVRELGWIARKVRSLVRKPAGGSIIRDLADSDLAAARLSDELRNRAPRLDLALPPSNNEALAPRGSG